jgi:hypothetical protein
MSSPDKGKKSKTSSSKKRAPKKLKANQLMSTTPQLSTIPKIKEGSKIQQTNIVSQADINNLFSEAFERHKKDIFLDKQTKLKEISHLGSMAEEYLSTFVLIGYSLQNEKVVIFNASNSKDEAALVDLLRATFIEIVNNRP